MGNMQASRRACATGGQANRLRRTQYKLDHRVQDTFLGFLLLGQAEVDDHTARAVDQSVVEAEVLQKDHLCIDFQAHFCGRLAVLLQPCDKRLLSLVESREQMLLACQLCQMPIVFALHIAVERIPAHKKIHIHVKHMPMQPASSTGTHSLVGTMSPDLSSSEPADAAGVRSQHISLVGQRDCNGYNQRTQQLSCVGRYTSEANRIEKVNEGLVTLPVHFRQPETLVDRSAPALGVEAELRPLIDWRQLEEIAAQYNLDAAEGLGDAADLAGDVLDLVEQVTRHHGHLVQHKHAGLLPPLTRVAGATHLRGKDGGGLLAEADAREAVQTSATDVAGGNASGCGDEDVALTLALTKVCDDLRTWVGRAKP